MAPPDCRRLEALLERELDRELTPAQDEFVRTHVAACPGCRERRAFQARLRAAVDRSLARDEVPPVFVSRLMALLDAQEERG